MAQLKKNRELYDTREDGILIEDARVWKPDGIRRASILIQRGRIRKIARRVSVPIEERVRARGLLAIPGLVDVHVHLRDMALDYKEDFTSGTSAAAAGGFTTVLDMPNTIPPTDSKTRLEEKMSTAREKILVNVGFHVAAVDDLNQVSAMAKSGAFSAKLYLPKPISPIEVGSDMCVSRIMRAADHNNLPITVHAEDQPTLLERQNAPHTRFADLPSTHPSMAEKRAVKRVLELQGRTDARVHFCHLTLPDSIRRINRAERASVTTEATPHHLLLSKQSLSKHKWKAWMVPPLRSDSERSALFAMAVEGKVSLVASDHAPHTIAEKSGSPHDSPPGVPGLETTLGLFLTLASRGEMSLTRAIQLLSVAPARIFGLTSKGELSEGKDGDVVLVDLKKKSIIRPENFLSKARFSPFEGTKTRGSVDTTIIGGRVVYQEGQIVASPGTGKVLRKR